MVKAEFYYGSKGDIKYIKQFYASACKAAKIEYTPDKLKFLPGKVAVLNGPTKFIENMVQKMNIHRRTGIVAKLAD